MLRSRLAAKITLLIVAVLIVGFGASTIWSLRREEGLLVEQNKMAARRLTSTLVASIEAAMLQERPDVTRAVKDSGFHRLLLLPSSKALTAGCGGLP